ncbi:MAG: Gfo/Idh/MocA family oxidoreductase [Oscillospiraceae bacterium]|nr:Gfo/Idh/MocA family oxidoreductase [Oscillospiraceae bacterium]
MLKSVIIGYGGIAQAAHVPGYQELEKRGVVKLAAAYDVDPAQFAKKQEINIGSGGDTPLDIPTYTDLNEMLDKENPDFVDVCAPTYVHAEIAAELLRRGYPVHSEKPMARTYEQCLGMIAAATESEKPLMIGQCLRFSPDYLFVKEAIADNRFGKVLSAVFRRQSAPPLWQWKNWMMDHAKSGGCLMDMHIHDVDMVRFLFGEPDSVSCHTQSISEYCGDDIVHSTFIYENGPSVLAVGDWSQQGVGFAADYRIAFEKATVIFENWVVTVYPRNGEKWTPDLSKDSMYMLELEYFAGLVTSGGENTQNPPESAAETVKLVEALKTSANQNGQSVKP